MSSAVEELAHALDPVLGDEIAESDRVRTTIAATLDALAELIDAVGAGREVDPDGACRSNLTELERFATESDDLALTARLGAVLHTARRIVAAMGLEVR